LQPVCKLQTAHWSFTAIWVRW